MSSLPDDLRDLDTPLVLYVGDALPRAAGLPSEAELAQTLLREAQSWVSPPELEELAALATGPDLSGAFTELSRVLTPATFGRVVERALDDDNAEVPPLGRALKALRGRIRGVITPNLDHLIERAFEGRLVVHSGPVADLPSRTGWLLKLHGTLRDRGTWAFTEEQRGHLIHRDPLHGDVFRALFLAHPIVFVGTSLNDPLLGDMLQQIQALSQGQPPRHWALVPSDEARPIQRRKLAASGVTLVTYDPVEGPIALLEALVPGAAPTPSAATVASAPAATVAPAQAAAPPPPQAPPAPPPAPTPTPAPAPTPTEQASADTLSILFLAANPAGTDPLRLDRELRIIREAIERSRHRVSLRLSSRPAASVHDLRRALLDDQYDLVHISGHGEQDGLVLEDERGDGVQIPRAAVARLFARYAPPHGSLRCVVLNACWSRTIGDEASMEVPFTVAMDGPISDDGALEFSRGFYDALGAGFDFPRAFEEGQACVELAAPGATFNVDLIRHP